MPNKFSSLLASLVLAVTASATLAQPVAIQEQLLERGAVADTTPQQRYRTAINEASGGYKLYLAECAAMAAAERTACRRDAKTVYDRDMAAARAILRTR
jgi:ABC-type sugar transport system substrate-binding protein